MKRTIACMLMTVVLLLSLSVPVAGELIEYDYPRNTVLLWNADENWGDRYTLDTQNQTEGEGCISINLNGVTGTHAPSKKLDPVDATGMLAFEFDMYISDLAILDHLQNVSSNSIEICSGGKCDEGEKNIPLSDVAKQLKNGCPKVGWNRVIVFLNKMGKTEGSYGPFDISHINYLRIYWTGMTDCGQDWIMKFDNFVLTDREVEPSPSHAPGEWQYDENKHWRYCTECDKKIDEGIHAAHTGKDGHVRCEEGFVCYACKQTCEPTGHNLTKGYPCYNESGHAMDCGYCRKPVGPYIPHIFSEWRVLWEATETEEGLRSRDCGMCGYSESEGIPKTVPDPEDSQTPDVPETPQTPEQPDEPSDNGCTSVVGGAGFCVVALMLAAGVAFRKKK